jgi:hypothetical protein
MTSVTAQWAKEEFGQADLGDARRTARLTLIATRVAERPAGKVSEVFEDRAERTGAYDFLESEHVTVERVMAHVGKKTAERAAACPFAFVAIDGSSLNLTERGGAKGFGRVGTRERGARGLKVITALAVSPRAETVGVLDQQWWARDEGVTCTGNEKRVRNMKRTVDEKETQHWLDSMTASWERANEAGAKLWLQLDREADNKDMLVHLASSQHTFTVRGSYDRVVIEEGGGECTLRAVLAREAPQGHYALRVSAGPKRTARVARIVVRSAKVTLRLKDGWSKRVRKLDVHVVEAREESTTPQGEKAIDWMLVTNAPVASFEDACRVVKGYAMRWRIEEFHKTWKSGACRVEEAQLRSFRAACVWATIVAVVAARAERLKHLSRTSPDEPASIALDAHEIRALILLKRDIKKRTETIPDSMPSLSQAVGWIADLGGYTGKSSGGPPGSIVIRRGLERLRPAAQMLRILDDSRR